MTKYTGKSSYFRLKKKAFREGYRLGKREARLEHLKEEMMEIRKMRKKVRK